MNSLDLAGLDWLGRGWWLILAFSAATLCVAWLRRPCRRLFGAERGFQLWLLPPLAMLASQLPHVASADRSPLPSLVYAVSAAVGAAPERINALASPGWRSTVVLVWLAGIMASLALAALAQSRYRRRLRGATPMASVQSRWPVLRAANDDVGPALVGAWQARIVLPADFEHRYDLLEQSLILAHEAMHARRHDGYWCLFGWLGAALFWFHPLAWWALAALRHDQELACDAAVLHEHGTQRRAYAHALLKTHAAQRLLPVGCSWSPCHPLTERIAMLKWSSPSRLRRNSGRLAGFALALVVVGSAYAVAAPQTPQAVSPQHHADYQLNMLIELAHDDGQKNHAQAADFALCVASGTPAMASVGNFQVEATTVPAASGQVRIDLAVTGGDRLPVAHQVLDAALGKAQHVAGTAVDGKHTYAIDITAQAGCPARAIAEASAVKVTEHVKNGTARAVAESIAAKAGWTLVNPDALGSAAVTLSFNDMPAGTALQQVANLAGVKLVLDGKQARFEAN